MSRSLQAEVELVVPFHDVDAMDVVWHGHYAKYCEIARCRLLQSFDYDYPQMRASGYLWPIVEWRFKFVRPARYGQRLRVRADLLEYENRMKIGYEIRDVLSGERVGRGHSVLVALHAGTGELQYVSPSVLLERIQRCR